MQLDTASRLQIFVSNDQEEAVIYSFIFSNFNCCPLFHISVYVSHHKSRKDTASLFKNYLQ